MSRVVVVAGAGRSGTSTVAGALTKLGLHLPQPEVPADDTNPRGFFESQWVVDFHKGLLNRGPVVRTLDARPEAQGLTERLPTPADAARLDAWLGDALVHPQVLVKDPRVFWFHDLWRAQVKARGAELGFVTMLRHPAEVARSRDTHYTPDRGDRFRRHRVTADVAGWCHACLVTEEVTRPDRRVFVRYVDLLSDWRGAIGPVVERLGIEIDADLTTREHHAVDDFVDAGLSRSEATWDLIDVPDTLRAVAEGVWEQMNRLVVDPDDPSVAPALATLRVDYDRLFEHAVGVALDHTSTRETAVRRRTRANLREEYEAQVAELEQQLEEAQGGGRGEESADAGSSGFFGRRGRRR